MNDSQYFIDRLVNTAASSDDPDTHTACIVVHPDGQWLGSPNALPKGISISHERTERPAKYRFIQHAERRAIALSARYGLALKGCTAFLNWFPCAECAGSLIDAGIAVLYAEKTKYEERKEDPRYGFAEAMEMLLEAGVRIKWF